MIFPANNPGDDGFARGGLCAPPRRRGVALLLVMSVLVLAGLIAYSLLSAAAVDAKSAAHIHSGAQARAMAESGVQLAMHYLLRPETSPAALVKGAAGDWHYPGQLNIAIGEDTVDVAVTNPAPATYIIETTGRSAGPDGETAERRLRVRVVGVGTWAATGAAQFAGNVQLDDNIKIDGDLVAAGDYVGGGTVVGQRLAANYTAHDGDPSWGAPPQVPELAVPSFASLTLVRAVAESGGKYTYNGASCEVDYVLLNPLTSPPLPSAGNPARIFVYTGTTPLALTGENMDLEGTLVLTQADLEVHEVWRIRPLAGLPALLVAGKTSLPTAWAQLRVEGVFYAGEGVAGPGIADQTSVEVEGAYLSGVESDVVLGPDLDGQMIAKFNATKAAVPSLARQGIRYERLQIESWEPAD